MEDGSEDGEMKQVARNKSNVLQPTWTKPVYVDSEIDKPLKAPAYDGEICDIEDEEEEAKLLEAKKTYLKQALSGQSRSIMKKQLVYADMAWGTDFHVKLLQDATRSPKWETISLRS